MADPEELWTEQAAEDPAPGRDDPPAADAAPAEDTAQPRQNRDQED